ncbi:MAG TPA: hypothetical protein VHQ47_08985 [Phycisphaerae bacterium]|nr:hypothetical protein [Phycisphaerae bacterium]HVV72433.1 hypothetical protein [Verrucomicrobiae bacterium]
MDRYESMLDEELDTLVRERRHVKNSSYIFDSGCCYNLAKNIGESSRNSVNSHDKRRSIVLAWLRWDDARRGEQHGS